MWDLLLEIEETVLIFVKVSEHVEALSLTDVVHHVVLQELVDVVRRDLSKLHPIDSLESCPWFETMLLGKLLSLFFDNFFVLRDGLE